MLKVTKQMWRIEGKKELYESLAEAVANQKDGTLIEPIVMVDSVEEPEDYIKQRREKKYGKDKEGK